MRPAGSKDIREVYDINRKITRIGASEESNVPASDASVDDVHAIMQCRDGGHWITDEGSKGGTFLLLCQVPLTTPFSFQQSFLGRPYLPSLLPPLFY